MWGPWWAWWAWVVWGAVMDDAQARAYVLGIMGGDQSRADAAMAVILGNRSLRAAAREHGLTVDQVRWWVGKVRRGLERVLADGSEEAGPGDRAKSGGCREV